MPQTITINRLPAPTWNWLRLNAAAAPAPAAQAVPELDGLPQSITQTLTADPWPDVESAAGPALDEALAAAPARVLALPAGAEAEAVLDAPAGKLFLELAPGAALRLGLHSRADALQLKARLAPGARLELAVLQTDGGVCVSDIGVSCAENARFALTRLDLGVRELYAGAAAALDGKASDFTAVLGYLASGEEKLDYSYTARHRGQKTTCDMAIRGVLAGAARKLLRGTIDLQAGCAGAVGTEQEDVLLLGDGVVNQTIPLILCAEEDVEGNHGASIGKLDDSVLFYLASRGISEQAARRILARARVDAVAARLPAALAAKAAAWMEEHADVL